MDKALLSVDAIRREYGLGRDLTSYLIKLMPHIKIGRSGRGERLLVKRSDFECLLNRATTEDLILWDLVRQHTPSSLQAWLTAQIHAGAK